MYEDMLEFGEHEKQCESCQKKTTHIEVALCEVEHTGAIYEVIDTWFECRICGQTTIANHTLDDLPF